MGIGSFIAFVRSRWNCQCVFCCFALQLWMLFLIISFRCLTLICACLCAWIFAVTVTTIKMLFTLYERVETVCILRFCFISWTVKCHFVNVIIWYLVLNWFFFWGQWENQDPVIYYFQDLADKMHQLENVIQYQETRIVEQEAAIGQLMTINSDMQDRMNRQDIEILELREENQVQL